MTAKWLQLVAMPFLIAPLSSAAAQPAPPPEPPPAAAPPAPQPDSTAEDLRKAAEELKSATSSLADTSKKLEEATKKLDDAAAKLKALDEASKKLDDAASKLKGPEDKKLLQARTPWNGFFLLFSEKEKKATVSVSYPFEAGRYLLGASVTAPLDEETRRAAFTDSRGQPAAFQGKVSFEYNGIVDSNVQALRESIPNGELCNIYLDERITQSCPSERFHEWLCERVEEGDERITKLLERTSYRNACRHGAEGAFERPTPPNVSWALGGELAFAVDRKEVYESDVGAEPEHRTGSQMRGSAVLRLYPTYWLATPIKVGAGYKDAFEVKEVDRCETIPSSDSAVSGRSCKKVLLLKSDDDVQAEAHVEASLVFAIPVPALAEVQPGFELRTRVDGLGATEILRNAGTVFVSPTTDPVFTRFGVGLEHNLALDTPSGADPDFERGDAWLVPFLLVGAGL